MHIRNWKATLTTFPVMAVIIVIAHASTGPGSYPQTLPAVTPGVSPAFQPIVKSLTAQGLQLIEALEANLEGDSQHLAAIFQNKNPKEPTEACEFRIFEKKGASVVQIFHRAEFFFTFQSDEFSHMNGSDLNGDGLKEIIVQSSSGGNCWSCNPTEIYRVKNHKVELIAAGPILKIQDLNSDVTAELLVTDARWEIYDELSHAASPSAIMVYTWRGGRYVYASQDFPAFYKAELGRLHKEIEDAITNITAEAFSDEEYIGLVISLMLTRTHMGQIDEGLKELEAMLNSNIKSPDQAKRRKTIIDDLKSGESAKRLREMKYGDPMQLE